MTTQAQITHRNEQFTGACREIAEALGAFRKALMEKEFTEEGAENLVEKTGLCHGLLFRVNDRGDLEVKCHRCHRIQTVSRETLDRYRVMEYATT
jgi:hypothetical protein